MKLRLPAGWAARLRVRHPSMRELDNLPPRLRDDIGLPPKSEELTWPPRVGG